MSLARNDARLRGQNGGARRSRGAGCSGSTSPARATAGGPALDGCHKVLDLATPGAEARAESAPVRLLE